MGTLAELNKKGKYLLVRTIVVSAIGAAITNVAIIPFFSFSYGKSAGTDSLNEIFTLLRNIIPSNLLSPFIDGNMLQICLIAFIVGNAVLILGDKVEKSSSLIIEANSLFLTIIDFICTLLSLYIFADLTNLFWSNGLDIVLDVWKPILIAFICSVIFAVISVSVVSIKYQIPFSSLIKKVYPSYIITLSTASSLAAFGTVQEINEKSLE